MKNDCGWRNIVRPPGETSKLEFIEFFPLCNELQLDY